MSLSSLTINAERLQADFNELSEIGATIQGGISRLALSNEDLEARAWLADRIDAAGLSLRDDDAGNLSGVLFCDHPKARSLLVGSHLDTVPNAGRYDGSIGVLAGLECLRTIKEAGLKLPVHLEAINFTDEEGCWQSLFGSRGLTGSLSEIYTVDKDEDYGPFRAALFRAGIRPADVQKARRDPNTIAGYLELHIEQGDRLDIAGIDIGIVTGIVGRTTYEITFYGQASHSGTTGIEHRRDALLGASAYITEAFRLWHEDFREGILNCGNLQVFPGKFNLIPAEARLTMECRHNDEVLLREFESALLRLAQEQAVKHGLTVNTKRVAHMRASTMSDKFIDVIEQVCTEREVSHTRLLSYAGHDAQMLGNYTQAGMIFIPSVGGISHSPREFSHWEHVLLGTNILLHTLLRLADSLGSNGKPSKKEKGESKKEKVKR